MKVILIATGETVEVNDSYGSRLYEQGKAIPSPKKTAKAEPREEPEQKTEPEKKPKTTAKKKE